MVEIKGTICKKIWLYSQRNIWSTIMAVVSFFYFTKMTAKMSHKNDIYWVVDI